MSDNPSARSGSPWAAPAFFSTLLVVELILDILPFDIFVDPVLIPSEAVIDIALLAASIYGRRHQAGGTSGGTTRELSSNRRAVGVLGVVFLLFYWFAFASSFLFLLVIVAVNPLLGTAIVTVELAVGVLLTYWLLTRPTKHSTSGGKTRELSSNRRAIGGGSLVALAYWGFTASIIVVQFWWNSQNPFLGFFAIFLEIPFDIVLILFGFYVTYKVLSAPRQTNVYAQPAREV